MAVPEQDNIKRIKAAIEAKIRSEQTAPLTREQECYISGLSDAIEIINDVMQEEYIIGRMYYVIMPDGDVETKIVKMQLYRINNKSKTAYCFAAKDERQELVLYNKGSLKLRVHETLAEAEKYRSIALQKL